MEALWGINDNCTADATSNSMRKTFLGILSQFQQIFKLYFDSLPS